VIDGLEPVKVPNIFRPTPDSLYTSIIAYLFELRMLYWGIDSAAKG
jgi:hypothetical protein